MNRGNTLSTSRLARVYEEALWARRELYRDSEYFKMPEPWKRMCEAGDNWSIKTYRANEMEDYKRKAAVVAFDGRVKLTLDERLMEKAEQGCMFSNFVLAHEWGHLLLDHHGKGAVTKNFQLYSGPGGMLNIPPTLEELETHYAAVFFQCGIALKSKHLSALELAMRAYSDPKYVKKAQGIVRLEAFERELSRPKPKYERVIL